MWIISRELCSTFILRVLYHMIYTLNIDHILLNHGKTSILAQHEYCMPSVSHTQFLFYVYSLTSLTVKVAPHECVIMTCQP